MEHRIGHCGIVVLAAGQSSRLGTAKQLLAYKGATLLRHTVEVALEAGCGPVVVVTGANGADVAASLQGLMVDMVQNDNWQEGMASSLRMGLTFIREKYPATDGVIFMVCDQPFVNKSVLLCLIETQLKTGKAATASSYSGKTGTPALFHSSFFERLMELKGDKGARVLIAAHPDEVSVVPFEKGAIDIDTKEDYEQLLNH